MNLMQTQRAVFKSPLSSTQKLVLIAVLDHWSRRNPTPRPGLAALMRHTSLARQTVIDAVDAVVKLGVIPDPRNGKGKPWVFQVDELVQSLDQLPVRSLDQIGARERASTGLSAGTTGLAGGKTGLARATNQHQNGSDSTEGTRRDQEGTKAARGAVAPTRTKRRSYRATKPERTSEQKKAFCVARDAYFAAFKEARGEDPAFDVAAGNAVYRLLEKKLKWDVDRAVRTIRAAYAAGSWHRDKATIQDIAANPDKYSGATTGNVASIRRALPPQPTEDPGLLAGRQK